MKADNNVNSVGKGGRLDVYNLKDKDLTDLQEAFVRKIVGELKDCDNIYYEICNEPYFGGVTKEWNDRIAAVVADAEKGLPARHLIAQNSSNGSAEVKDPNANVNVLNFHYCSPPDAVAQNYGLGRAVGFDETGFRGTADRPYRTDAWDFLIAGGSVYSNLDYSFSVAPRRHAQGHDLAGRRRPRAAQAARHPEGIHGRPRPRAYEAGQRGREGRPHHGAADRRRQGSGEGGEGHGARRWSIRARPTPSMLREG